MRKTLLTLLALQVVLSGSGQFVNVTSTAMKRIPSQVEGRESIAWPDVNDDGCPDLFIGSKHLYLNMCDGLFELQDPAQNGFDAMGDVWFARSTWADADNDDDLDCVVSSYYGNFTQYFRNNGPPLNTFTSSNLYTHEPSVYGGQPTFFNADKDLTYEIYLGMLGNWTPFTVGKDRLFDWVSNKWTDVSATRMPELETSAYRRPVRGNVACDYDNDNDMDLYVPVYGITASANNNNILWQNDGAGNFTDVAWQAGVAVEPNSNYGGLASSASWGDFNNDGLFDLVVANIHGRVALYKNLGNGQFSQEKNAEVGLPNINYEWHNTLWFDYDNDGDLDLFLNQWYDNQIAFLFRNDGPENLGTFTDVTNQLGFNSGNDLNFVTGWAVADYDRDGDLDLAFYNDSKTSRGFYLWRNDHNNDNKWLIVKLIGNRGSVNRNALGAKVRILFNDDTWSPVKQVEASSCDQGMNMHPVHFGLGKHSSYRYIRVTWPHGVNEYFTPGMFAKPVNSHIDLRQGAGTPTLVDLKPELAHVQVFRQADNIIVTSQSQLTHVALYSISGSLIGKTETVGPLNKVVFAAGHLKGVYIVAGEANGNRFAEKVAIF